MNTQLNNRKEFQEMGNPLPCFYCSAPMNKIKGHKRKCSTDHLIPRSRGGKHELANFIFCCCKCNSDKGHLTLEEYRLVVAYRRGEIDEAPMKFYGEVNPQPHMLLNPAGVSLETIAADACGLEMRRIDAAQPIEPQESPTERGC